MQTYNPLGYTCLPNEATPEYVVCNDFGKFVAYGLMTCWLSHDENDPNADCSFPRPYNLEDVKELRGFFLDILETSILSLWENQYAPGAGEVEGNWQTLSIKSDEEGESVDLVWYVNFRQDAMMFSLAITDSGTIDIWLSYESIQDRKDVLHVLTAAHRTLNTKVWDKLVKYVEN